VANWFFLPLLAVVLARLFLLASPLVLVWVFIGVFAAELVISLQRRMRGREGHRVGYRPTMFARWMSLYWKDFLVWSTIVLVVLFLWSMLSVWFVPVVGIVLALLTLTSWLEQRQEEKLETIGDADPWKWVFKQWAAIGEWRGKGRFARDLQYKWPQVAEKVGLSKDNRVPSLVEVKETIEGGVEYALFLEIVPKTTFLPKWSSKLLSDWISDSRSWTLDEVKEHVETIGEEYKAESAAAEKRDDSKGESRAVVLLTFKDPFAEMGKSPVLDLESVKTTKEILIGKDEKGKELSIPADLHVLIAGQSGVGKTVLLQQIIAQHAFSGAKIWLIGLVHPDLYVWSKHAASAFLSNPEVEAFGGGDEETRPKEGQLFSELLQNLDRQVTGRIVETGTGGLGSSSGDRILLAIDDLHGFLQRSTEEDQERLRSILHKGRAGGVTVISMMQHSAAKDLHMSFIRFFPIRVCFRVFDREISDLMLGKGQGEAGVDASVLKMDGYFYFVGTNGPTKGRSWDLSSENLDSVMQKFLIAERPLPEGAEGAGSGFSASSSEKKSLFKNIKNIFKQRQKKDSEKEEKKEEKPSVPEVSRPAPLIKQDLIQDTSFAQRFQNIRAQLFSSSKKKKG